MVNELVWTHFGEYSMPVQNVHCTRRMFTTGLFAGVFGGIGTQRAFKSDPPFVANPRATDGDDREQPRWDELLTITVGTKEGKADFFGSTERVLQAAVDSAARNGGGTVQLLPGTWTLRNSVFLPAGIRLTGSGADTILTRPASVTATLAEDSDWYDQEITLTDASGFEVGDGVLLRAVNPHNGTATVIKRTLTARSGNRFRLNNGLRENLWLSGKPTCSTLYPLLTSEYTADVTISNLTLDGNRSNTEHLDGNYGGCIFLQDCNRYVIESVTAQNNNGDGISFQICHDIRVEKCRSLNNADLGVHPGSGSQRPIIRDNLLAGNSQGLFWCWGVKYGLAEFNRIENNSLYGISIGHNDTDNVMRSNRIVGSGQIGILFRNEDRGADFWPNRNTLEDNTIENSGGEDGVAIEVRGKTRDLAFTGNTIRELRAPAGRIGLRISPEAGAIRLENNTFSGFRTDVVDQRKP